MMPIKPPACAAGSAFGLGGLMGGQGNHGSMGGHGNMGGQKSPNATSTLQSHSRRQTTGTGGALSSIESLMPAVAVFVGGGGSAGSGAAFSGKNSDVKTGVFISKTDKFAVSSEIVNYDAKDKEVYFTLDFEYMPGKAPGLMNVGMGAISVDDCSSPSGSLQPPKGKAIIYKGSEWTIMEDGYFVSFTPHLHDGGVYTKVFLNGMTAAVNLLIKSLFTD
jgi:hypothetical protein